MKLKSNKLIPSKHEPIDTTTKEFKIFDLQINMQIIQMEERFRHLIKKDRNIGKRNVYR